MQIFKDAIFEDTVSSTLECKSSKTRYLKTGSKHQKHEVKRTKEQVEDTEDTGEDLKIRFVF